MGISEQQNLNKGKTRLLEKHSEKVHDWRSWLLSTLLGDKFKTFFCRTKASLELKTLAKPQASVKNTIFNFKYFSYLGKIVSGK